tara:strand:- start:39107 stop:40345 length:1239 start_codon:yes stop_codon:yes gene_type:complete
MANERKSIIDEALLESAQIEKAFEANAKEILTRTMSSEIEEMVKESLEGSIGLTEDEDEEKDELELDLELGDSDEMDASGAGEEVDLEMGELEMDDEPMDGEIEMDDVESIDLTTTEMPEVINVFKKMSDDDEIEVVTDGGNVEIKDTETGAEYRIELGGEESEMEDMEADMVDMEPEMGDMDPMELDNEDESEEEEVEYQVVLDDEDEDDEDGMEDEMSGGDYMDDMEEGKSPRTLSKASKQPNRKSADINSNRMKMGESKKPKFLKLINENKDLKNKVGSITSENETLKEDYNKMVDALKQFRDKLNEVAVFNSNLTYSVRLFTENTTTKEEKLEIIKRFDDVKTLKESKATYKGLVKEISKKEPIKESVEEKLNETKTSGSSTEINESQVYVNPELEKMKKLWDYQYKH